MIVEIQGVPIEKTLQADTSNPKHIQQDHQINLSKLISNDHKFKKPARLK